MANTTTSPNMGLTVPVVGVDPGPDWATNLVTSLGVIDGHTHTAGSGVAITPSAININSDLTFSGNNATSLRTARFASQSSALAGASDLGCLYVVSADLYYNDENGNQVRITQGGSVAGSTGTITGLPSGTASASYSSLSSTFTFQSATNTPANLAVGPVTIGKNSSGSNTITIQPATAIAANYSLQLPAVSPSANTSLLSDTSGNLTWNRAGVYSGSTYTFTTTSSLPANMQTGPLLISPQNSGTYHAVIQCQNSLATNYSIQLPNVAATNNQIMMSDGSGNLSWTQQGLIPLGAIIATFPSLSGAYSTTATTAADSYGFVLCAGQTISDSTSPMNGATIPNVNGGVFLQGSNVSGNTGGAANVTLTTSNLPSHAHGAGSYATSLSGTFANTNHYHLFNHVHATAYIDTASNAFCAIQSADPSRTSVANTDPQVLYNVAQTVTAGPNNTLTTNLSGDIYTTGVSVNQGGSGVGNSAVTGGPAGTASLSGSNNVTGTSSSIGSGSSFSVTPPYITAVHLMRIK